MRLTQYQMSIHARLESDLTFYAQEALIIKTKEGSFYPFRFNKAQDYLHQETEKMLREVGFVRIIIVKGRQQGCSTYVSARFFHKAIWKSAKSVFILSHEATSSENLFQKVELYHEKLPPYLKPTVDISNRRQLRFSNGSEYRVGTAGAGSTGRSQTNQYFHGSEVAFYTKTDEISSGALQTVADVPGTEIFLESTANGMAGEGAFFYQACMQAMENKGRYRLVFIPWYWQEEYACPVPLNHEFSQEELTIQSLYKLSDEQMYWRYQKIIELKSEWLFKQEYPCSVKEAFQTSGTTLLPALKIQAARKSTLTDSHAPLVMGVDPARTGDRTVIVFRRGREVTKYYVYTEMDQMRLAGIVAQFIDQFSVVKCFIDVGAGYGTIDRLRELGYSDVVTPVDFGETPIQNDVYVNKRAEMAGNMRDWFDDGIVRIPDDEDIETDLLAVPDFKINSNNLRLLVPKDKIRKDYGKSPDIFDALGLTFAYPVRTRERENRIGKKTLGSKEGSPLTTLNRARGHDKPATKGKILKTWER